MKILLAIFPVAGWTILWLAGGWMLAATLFRLRRSETAMVGLGIGLVLQAWLVNLLAHGLPILTALWLSAVLVFSAGTVCAIIFRHSLAIEFSPLQWLLLALLSLLFFAMGNGLGIFDDYQNLPTISLMAAGDIPPHFALNPSLNFGYHYLLLLVAAQFMRLGHMFPWNSLDLARGFILALPLLLAGLWAHRLTHSRLAALLTSLFLAFAGGARWLLLLLPAGVLDLISSHITLIGSASTSGSNLAHALLSNWNIDGAGPIPFPFAFYTGINQPYIMAYTGISGMAILIMLILLLTAGRWRHSGAGIVSAALIASLAIANEVAFGVIALGFAIVVGSWLIIHRTFRLQRRGGAQGGRGDRERGGESAVLPRRRFEREGRRGDGPFLGPLRDAANTALAALKPEDEVALFTFSTEAELRVPFTKDKSKIAEQINKFEAGGATNINDGIFVPAEYFVNERPKGRRVIILISDDVGTDAGGQGTRDIVTEAIAADAVLYNLKIPGYNSPATRFYASMIPGLVNIRKVMDQTGGEIFDVQDVPHLDSVFRALIERIKTRYTLGYYTTANGAQGKPHKLDVRLAPSFGKKGRDYQLLAKNGYYIR